jgi:hypothetical protein
MTGAVSELTVECSAGSIVTIAVPAYHAVPWPSFAGRKRRRSHAPGGGVWFQLHKPDASEARREHQRGGPFCSPGRAR